MDELDKMLDYAKCLIFFPKMHFCIKMSLHITSPKSTAYLEIITWAFRLSPTVSTRDPIIKPKLSSRADNGRELILRAITKIPCYNLFVTYSKTLFRVILIQRSTTLTIDDFYSKIEELRHKNGVTSFLLTSQIQWHDYVACEHDNLSPFKMHDYWLSACSGS